MFIICHWGGGVGAMGILMEWVQPFGDRRGVAIYLVPGKNGVAINYVSESMLNLGFVTYKPCTLQGAEPS